MAGLDLDGTGIRLLNGNLYDDAAAILVARQPPRWSGGEEAGDLRDSPSPGGGLSWR
jgi:hypothetical protein